MNNCNNHNNIQPKVGEHHCKNIYKILTANSVKIFILAILYMCLKLLIMKNFFLTFLVIAVLIQFIRPEKNSSQNFENDISTVMEVPNEVQLILKTSCYDCHSNSTTYPWYSEIAPVSWFLASHVNDGKEHLNFSEWATYNEYQKSHIINNLEDELTEKGMPLKSYLLVHTKATLTDEQYKTLLNWVKTLK